jgi:hypothetical protein
VAGQAFRLVVLRGRLGVVGGQTWLRGRRSRRSSSTPVALTAIN